LELTEEEKKFIHRILMSWDGWWQDTRKGTTDEEDEIWFELRRRFAKP
jgi:hypothetical protein